MVSKREYGVRANTMDKMFCAIIPALHTKLIGKISERKILEG